MMMVLELKLQHFRPRHRFIHNIITNDLPENLTVQK